ncbi:thioesterase family protein [Parasulfitobacter algicola]|uniref:Fluoroacetyl-CoA-specific thioesterase-like domain-containing protein n=1 Tax=Parasulfitobacter algicola TaxID=2614809 RepID=A0ABX2J0B6_9RHOB|nr:hypothetical protein [Sulfitobacter algicola]NSX57067.1 hypothetical protein [Sulfitobacter algicola]
MQLETGLKGILTHQVEDSDLATSWRNDVPVLATPILLWLSELACMNAIDGCIKDDEMTVGFKHEMSHLAPTPKDWIVQITAELVEIGSKMLVFEVIAHDDEECVLRGRHTRAIIAKTPFIERVHTKSGTMSLTS